MANTNTNEGQHYDQEDTALITFADKTPFMNSLPYSVCFIDPKFNPDWLAGDCMNIAFKLCSEPDVRKGQEVIWSDVDQLEHRVLILDSTLLYVKGIRVRTYIVQFLEKDE